MNKILVDFDLVFDVDYGVLHLIKDKYISSKYIDKYYLENVERDALNYSLVKRTDINPLSLALLEEYMDSKDSLLEEILSSEYEEVLQLSRKTNIFNLLNTYIISGQVSVILLCKNIQQEQCIKNLKLNIDTVVHEDFAEIDISIYDCIFIKNYKDILKFKEVGGKSIYIGNYGFNFKEGSDVKLVDMPLEITESNEIYTIDVYDTNINALG